MQSPSNLDEDTLREIQANFSGISSILDGLNKGLAKRDFVTSYSFISQNIEGVVSFIQEGIVSLSAQAMKIEKIYTSSPLQISLYKAHPSPIFAYRDAVRRFSDIMRGVVDNLYANVNRTLAAYIFVYETLEKFQLKTPFVLLESNEFLARDLNSFVFGLFDKLGEKPKYRQSRANIITYSGIDIDDPLSLLIIGHETFHIINQKLGIFDSFCKNTSFCWDQCCEEAFIDIMCCLYYGPAYTYAVRTHFQKRYPLSGHSHLEMNVRMFILGQLVSTLKRDILKNEERRIEEFIKTLERRMDPASKVKAKEDKEKLDKMLNKGVIGHISHYFKELKITTYQDFLDTVEKREFESKIGKMDRKRIGFMLKNEIPVAVRPVTLLNTLCESGDIECVDSRLIVSSLKKWYVKRYYEKSREKIATEFDV